MPHLLLICIARKPKKSARTYGMYHQCELPKAVRWLLAAACAYEHVGKLCQLAKVSPNCRAATECTRFGWISLCLDPIIILRQSTCVSFLRLGSPFQMIHKKGAESRPPAMHVGGTGIWWRRCGRYRAFVVSETKPEHRDIDVVTSETYRNR